MNDETGCPATAIVNEIEESCDPETEIKKVRLIGLKMMLLGNTPNERNDLDPLLTAIRL